MMMKMMNTMTMIMTKLVPHVWLRRISELRKAQYSDDNEDSDNDDSNDHNDINNNDDNINDNEMTDTMTTTVCDESSH